MKQGILLTGKRGQVGTELAVLLPRLGEVVALGHEQLDLSKPASIRRTIQELRPQLIVNAAAYTAVDQAEKDEAAARAVNAEAPTVMAEEAKKIGALLIHYSTDYVFDGSKASPYEEDDAKNPLSAYGRTKLAGEQGIQSSGAAHLIFRTSWVYATSGRNFLLTILRLASQREELRIVCDQVGAPTRSREIAQATAGILEQILQKTSRGSALEEASGTYHMTASGTTTWHAFATAILEEALRLSQGVPWFELATNGKPLLARRVIPITTAEYPTPACRPAYSILSNSRLKKAFAIELPDWRSQLRLAFTGQTTS